MDLEIQEDKKIYLITNKMLEIFNNLFNEENCGGWIIE